MDKNRDKIRDLAYRICDSNPKLHNAKSCDECPCSLGCMTQYFAKRAYEELSKIISKHYVIMYEYAMTDSNGVYTSSCVAVYATHDCDAAIAKLREISTDECTYATEHDWVFYKNSDVEIDAGEPGNYTAEHFKYTLVELTEEL